MSPIAIGVEAKAPNELVPGIAKRHATFSLATVRASIGVRVVALRVGEVVVVRRPAVRVGGPFRRRHSDPVLGPHRRRSGSCECERGDRESREPGQNAITARSASPRAAAPSASLIPESGERDETSSSSRRRPSR